MPPVIVAVIAYAAGYITLTTLVVTAITYALSAILTPKPKAPSAPNFTNYSRDRTLSVRQPVQPRRVIYGQVKVGGTIVFLHATDNDTHLHLVIAVAGHQVQEIGDLYLNDELVPVDGSGDATGKYAGFVRIKKHLGSTSQTADTDLMSEASDKWTSAHRLQGIAYFYLRLVGSADLFPNGLPNISAVVTGKNDIYDPRGPSTGYSNNAALCIADYLSNTKYGISATYANTINEDALVASANVCDESVSLLAGGTQSRYTLNGSFESNQKPEDNVGEMLSAMSGKVVYSGGQWSVIAGYYVAPALDLDEDDARGPVKVFPRISRRDLYNAVKGVYVSPDNLWQPADFPVVTNATYETQDDGERIFRDINLPYTTDVSMAQRIAKVELEKSRQQIVCEFPCKLSALKVRAGDTVTLTLARFGWSSKVFEVSQWKFESFEDEQGEPAIGILLTLRETASTIYDWSTGDETAVDPAPDTTLPDPFTVGAPANLAAASGTDHLLILGEGSIVSRIYVSWDALANVYVQRYECEFKRASDTVWTPAPTITNSTAVYIQPVEDATLYDIRVRAINSLGVRGAYSMLLNHLVVGKTEAPPTPNTFTVVRVSDGTRRYAWTLNSVPADVRSGGGYMIRYKSGSTSDWDAMTALHNGILTNSPYESNELAAGTWTLAIKTIDSSGNESDAALFTTVTLGDPRLKNVLVQRLEHVLEWPGTLTGCFVNSNILIPVSTSTISGLPATIAGLAATINAIGTNTNPIVYETEVIDLGADVSFTPLVTIVGTGSATVTMKTGTTADGSVTGAYGALAMVEGKRYVKIKVSMADTAATIETMVTLIDSETVVENYEDVNTSTEASSWFSSTAAGHFKIGSREGDMAAISQATIAALQSVGPGWTWELISKSQTVNGYPAAEFKIYDNTGTLADAVVDVELKGPKS